MSIDQALQLSLNPAYKFTLIIATKKALAMVPQSQERDMHLKKVGVCRSCLPKALLFLKQKGVQEI